MVTMVTKVTEVTEVTEVTKVCHTWRESPSDQIMVLKDHGQIPADTGVGGGAGLHYEVVLEKAKTRKMPRPQSAPACRKYEDIQQKLQVN